VSGCPFLEDFRPFDNDLTSLDLSNNPLLKLLSCEQNQLTSLNVSNNLELNALWCGENLLTSLDLSQNSKIGSEPWQWDHLNVDNMPSLGEVCVWDSFPGDAMISYDGSPNVCFDSVSCNGVCNPGIGIEEFDHSDLMIYPNPASDILTIETSSFGPHSIKIYSMNGQEIYAASFTGTLRQIDLSFFRKGIYFLHIRSDNLTATRKVVKI
jgi:Leucine-rich repeat (LRR) protein